MVAVRMVVNVWCLFFVVTWVGGVVCFFHLFKGHMGVDLCSSEAGVSHESLDGVDVGSMVEHGSGEGVS